MRAASAGTVPPNKVLLWESLVDAAEHWGTRSKKSFSGSSSHDAEVCKQVQTIPTTVSDSGETNLRVNSYEKYAAYSLQMRRLPSDACRGVRSTYGPVGGSMYEGYFPGFKSTDSFSGDVSRGYKRAYLSGFLSCRQESRHAQPLASFRRALSTLIEKHLDEDAPEQQSSVPSQQQSSYPAQQHSSSVGQQSSLGGQQSSLEVPDAKPVGGSAWSNPDNAASYVLMSNIYADGDRWDEVKRINEMRLKARAWKKPGKAYVEIQAKVHEFIVGDRTHQDSTNIYEKLRKIKRQMGHIGYVPYVDLVLENRSYYDPYKPR